MLLTNTAITTIVVKRLLAFTTVVVLTACGGGTPEGYDMESGAPGAMQNAKYNGQSFVNSGLSSSKPNNASGDFNPALWNDRQWFDCDCSRTASPMKSAPW